jgi:hypothetical protein
MIALEALKRTSGTYSKEVGQSRMTTGSSAKVVYKRSGVSLRATDATAGNAVVAIATSGPV